MTLQGASSGLRNILVITMLASALTACTNVAMSGAQAAYNHKSLQNNVQDQYITMQAIHVLNRPRFNDANIDIATANREVLLAGQVPKAWQKEEAEQRVAQIPNVDHVFNMLSVSSPASSLVHASDAWITAKVKSKLIASNDVDATRVKVVTERGRVYLMGIVLPEEADAVVDIASNTHGVTSVVKLFSYMRITRT